MIVCGARRFAISVYGTNPYCTNPYCTNLYCTNPKTNKLLTVPM